VTYTQDDEDARLASEPLPSQSLANGDGAYIASWHDDKLDLQLAVGPPLDPERHRRMVDDVRGWIGQPDFVLDAIAGKPLPPVGKPIALPAAQMGPSLGDDAVVKTAQLRVLGVARDIATLEQTIVFHAVDRETQYDVTAIVLVEVSTTTGKRLRQSTRATLAWAGTTFDLTESLVYRSGG
jgi:hypothetical protein